jgi:hypothetical protein
MNQLTYRIFFILFLIGTQSIAQKKTIYESYDFSCTTDLYQLVNNQLNILSVNGRGEIAWVPILPEFERPLSALVQQEVNNLYIARKSKYVRKSISFTIYYKTSI